MDFGGAPEEWTLGDAIDAILVRLPADLAVWERLADRYSLDLFCGLHLASFNRGLALGPDVLRQLADRRLELDLDIYCVQDHDAAS